MRSQLLLLALSLVACQDNGTRDGMFLETGYSDLIQNAKNIINFFNKLDLGNVNLQVELDSVVRPDSVNGLRDFMPCQNGDGICTSGHECKEKGGSVIGGCQNCVGCAVCCKYDLSCQAVTADYISYFSSPGYPSPRRRSSSCSATVKVRQEVCQVRLDFLEFEMAAPPAPPVVPGATVPAMCQCRQSDSLNIRNPRQQAGVFGPGNNRLCGLNTGKHIYLDVNPESLVVFSSTTSGTAPVPLAGTLRLGSNAASKWNIKITQIPCGRPEQIVSLSSDNEHSGHLIMGIGKLVDIPQYYQDLRAPAGCLEYHSDTRGQFSNFGYDGRSLLLTNLDYSVCFKNPSDTCGATFRAKTFSMPSDPAPTCLDGSTEMTGAAVAWGVELEGRQCCQQQLNGDLESGFVGITSLSVAPNYAVPDPVPNFRTFFCGATLGGPANTVVQRGKGPIIVRVKTGNVCPPTDCPYARRPTEVFCPAGGCVGFRIDYNVDTGTC